MSGALDGLRVVEFSAGLAGPWIGRLMAYCGAEVIRVESRQHPDVSRLYVSPSAPELGIQPQLSPWFTDWNAGKRLVALDLTRAEGAALARRLVGISDVVIENYSAGVLGRLGLGYAELSRARPDLVMISSTGYGDSGPDREHVTWGPNIEAAAGLSTLSGFPERPCTITQYAYPDTLSALHGLFAVLCALDHRSRSGEGQYINLSQLEATASVLGHVLLEQLANGQEPVRLGNGSRHAAPYGCYPCSGEDRWCAVSIEDDGAWSRLCEVMDRPDWRADPRLATAEGRHAQATDLDAGLEAWTRPQDAYTVMERLQQAGIAAGVVQNVEDLALRDPQLAARNFFEEVEHAKKGKVRVTGIPLGLTGTPGRTGPAGAALGADTDYVFGTLLGLDTASLREYLETGVIERD